MGADAMKNPFEYGGVVAYLANEKRHSAHH
jgi:hypothetical protein